MRRLFCHQRISYSSWPLWIFSWQGSIILQPKVSWRIGISSTARHGTQQRSHSIAGHFKMSSRFGEFDNIKNSNLRYPLELILAFIFCQFWWQLCYRLFAFVDLVVWSFESLTNHQRQNRNHYFNLDSITLNSPSEISGEHIGLKKSVLEEFESPILQIDWCLIAIELDHRAGKATKRNQDQANAIFSILITWPIVDEI